MLQLDYFYGQEAEQFSFIRIPKLLFTVSDYQKLTAEAKLLYGLMLDRMSLSIRNGWLDTLGRSYIYFTMDEAMNTVGFGHNKAVRVYAELERVGLIERRKQGQGKPAVIYVKKFTPKPDTPECQPPTTPPAPRPSDNVYPAFLPEIPMTDAFGTKSETPEDRTLTFPAPSPASGERNDAAPKITETSRTGKEDIPSFGFLPASQDFFVAPQISALPVETPPEVPKRACNHTNQKKTEFNQTDLCKYPSVPSIPHQARQEVSPMMEGTMDRMDSYREIIQENIDYDVMVHDNPQDQELLDGYVELMAETCCSRGGFVRINRTNMPVEVVKSRLLKLTREHISYVVTCMKGVTTQIRNIRAYMLSSLYNAPTTIDQYYSSLVSYHSVATSG